MPPGSSGNHWDRHRPSVSRSVKQAQTNGYCPQRYNICMQLRFQQQLPRTLCGILLLALTCHAWSADEPKALEKKIEFPSPVQWKINAGIEVSLIGVAWGPANSPDMISRSREDIQVQKPEFYADRPYALALHFRAKLKGGFSTIIAASSGLGRVKNVDGDIEAPMELTPSGFVPYSDSPGVFDLRFDKSDTTEYWDLFPVSPDQKTFLFQVFGASGLRPSAKAPKLSFRVVLKDGEIVVIGATPDPGIACSNLKGDFSGTVGSGTRVKLQLKSENTKLAGTEQYERIGQTLWLKGASDGLGNFALEERYPEDTVTGIFKGKFSDVCQTMTGYFSKPDGSRLQPFEFHALGKASQRGADPSGADSSAEPQ